MAAIRLVTQKRPFLKHQPGAVVTKPTTAQNRRKTRAKTRTVQNLHHTRFRNTFDSMGTKTETTLIEHHAQGVDTVSTDHFLTHSDVRRTWPDLFVDVDDRVADMVVATAADTILEGAPMDREYIQDLITHAQTLGRKPTTNSLRAPATTCTASPLRETRNP